MRTKTLLTTTLILFGLGSSPAFADENADRCALYGGLGASFSDFMLPLTLQDLVNVIRGEDAALMTRLSTELIASLEASELATLMRIPADENAALSEASGMVAMNLLMTGAANSPASVKRTMVDTCLDVGAQTIIDNQRRSNAALDVSMGK